MFDKKKRIYGEYDSETWTFNKTDGTTLEVLEM